MGRGVGRHERGSDQSSRAPQVGLAVGVRACDGRARDSRRGSGARA